MLEGIESSKLRWTLNKFMIGAIIGDIVGSRFESSPKYPNEPVKDRDFDLFSEKCRFTDDTVLTCATADAIINRNPFFPPQFGKYYKKWGLNYPDRGYGSGFKKWLAESKMVSNNSFANGAMMRCSPIALFYNQSRKSALHYAHESVLWTHNSTEAIRGVQSIVAAIFMAGHGYPKEQIRAYVEEEFGHMLDITVEQARLIPKTSIRCNVTAPQALVAFMESTNYESAIRNAVYIGGDTDTNAAIAGAIAEAFYGVNSIPTTIVEEAMSRITPEIKDVIRTFYDIIGDSNSDYEQFNYEYSH